jgi:L-ribulokinase
VGAFDAHMGAVGAGVRPGRLVKVIGTSSCDMTVQPVGQKVPVIRGLCGIVEGSILPGLLGFEAGQSAVGDVFGWLVRFTGKGHAELTEKAGELAPGESGLVALDWLNGNRCVLVDPKLSGMILGLSLQTRPEEVYRALIEATAFGARVIVERLAEGGVRVDDVVCCGGIAEKNVLLMQIYADVMKRPMAVATSGQTCALGAAMFGAVVGGVHMDAEVARDRMAGDPLIVYEPDEARSRVYDELFGMYRELHDSFGVQRGDDGSGAGHFRLMKDLLAARSRTRRQD